MKKIKKPTPKSKSPAVNRGKGAAKVRISAVLPASEIKRRAKDPKAELAFPTDKLFTAFSALDPQALGPCSDAKVELMKQGARVDKAGVLAVSIIDVANRLRYLIFCARNFDMASNPPTTPFPPNILGPTERISLRPRINGLYFSDVKCQIDSPTLAMSDTPTKFITAVFNSIPKQNQIP